MVRKRLGPGNGGLPSGTTTDRRASKDHTRAPDPLPRSTFVSQRTLGDPSYG